MKYLYLLLALSLPSFALAQQVPDKIIYHADGISGQCILSLSFLKTQEKDSIWTESEIAYETAHKKVYILGAKLWGQSKMCGDRFYKMGEAWKDSVPTIVIQDKCADIDHAKYVTYTKSIFCETTTKWEDGKPDPNCISASVCDCRVMCLVELPAMTIQVRREILLTRNDEGKYVNNSEVIHN